MLNVKLEGSLCNLIGEREYHVIIEVQDFYDSVYVKLTDIKTYNKTLVVNLMDIDVLSPLKQLLLSYPNMYGNEDIPFDNIDSVNDVDSESTLSKVTRGIALDNLDSNAEDIYNDFSHSEHKAYYDKYVKNK